MAESEGAKGMVFLSYNSKDCEAVAELAGRLEDAGVKIWLDQWDLIPGQPWQPALQDALVKSTSFVMFIGQNGIGRWQYEETQAAIQLRVESRESKKRYPIIPVLLPGTVRGDRSKLPLFLSTTHWVEFHRTIKDERTFQILHNAIQGLPPGRKATLLKRECPYRGLEHFNVNDANLFFGREALTDWTMSALRGTLSAEGPTRFLAIVGASGSGKSSLARAGLLAALKEDGIEGSKDWIYTICRPGPRPLESLADAIAKTDGVKLGHGLITDLVRALENRFLDSKTELHLIARASMSESQASRRLVIFVDQFEEVFKAKEEERKAFIDNLLYASRVPDGQAIVLLTMRSDFYGKCAMYPELAAAVSEHQFLVGPMSDGELRDAIQRPAEQSGCEFDEGLVELLVKEVQRRPGALPILQYGLTQMWDVRQESRITMKSYSDIGYLHGIIEKRAEEVFRSFTGPQQDLCRQLFRRLVQPGEAMEDTKRQVHWQELASIGADSADMIKVVKGFAEARLLTTGGSFLPSADSVVEVSHEALIRNWGKARDWIESDRKGLRVHRRLTDSAKEWEKNGRDPGFLEHGTWLGQAREWFETRMGELSEFEQSFLLESVSQAELSDGILKSESIPENVRVCAFQEGERLVLQTTRLYSGPYFVAAAMLVALSLIIIYGIPLSIWSIASSVIVGNVGLALSYSIGLLFMLIVSFFVLSLDLVTLGHPRIEFDFKKRIAQHMWRASMLPTKDVPTKHFELGKRTLVLRILDDEDGWVAALELHLPNGLGSPISRVLLAKSTRLPSREAAIEQYSRFGRILNKAMGVNHLEILED